MKVQQLIDLLAKMPPNAPVVLSGSDHSYYEVSHATKAKADHNPKHDVLGEHGGKDHVAPGDKVINVVVIS